VEKQTRFMMDTYVTITAIGPKQSVSKAVDLALKRMQEVDVKFSSFNPKSQVYAFNYTNEPITDPEIIELIKVGLEVSKESAGAFDMTVAPLLELWGFNSKSYYLPQEEEIKNCLNSVGYEHLLIKDGKLTKDNPATAIDLGGIAKGYALTQAVSVLKTQGITSALVDAGGDIYTLGNKNGKLWKVGIKDPRGAGILGYVEVEDSAVLGSGDYERFFIKDGKRYHHIFNPKTGYPTEGVVSVTLIYSNPIIAQIWTKIPFVLGAKKGLEILAKIPDLEALIITSSGEKLYSAGLKHTLKVISEKK
jgi:thiamine biosynthesis lipoprotein